MKRLSLLTAAVLFIFLATGGLTAAQDVNTSIEQGMRNCEQGKYDAAVQNFNQALKLKPNDPAIITFRGVAYYAKGQNDRALEDFQQAIKIDPRHGKAYYQRGMIFYHQQNYDKAVEDFQKARSLGYKVDPVFIEQVQKEAAEKKR